MSTVTLHIGDVHERLAELDDGTVDLIVTSPPFLAQRDYLPAGHPLKDKEIGREPNPATFIDVLLALTAEFRRILVPYGSICVELGDKYAGSGGAGGDYNKGGLRDGQAKFGKVQGGRNGWPLAKSLTGIPTLYESSLAYGFNLLRGPDYPSPAGLWRIRNRLVWARPNPPVGSLGGATIKDENGEKLGKESGERFRTACSYITVACTGPRRWFDLDAVRTETDRFDLGGLRQGTPHGTDERRAANGHVSNMSGSNPAGAPPLDWHQDGDDGPTGDRLWIMPTAPYKGAHYATYPLELPLRLIKAMCPRQVCRTCGKARERIVGEATYTGRNGKPKNGDPIWRSHGHDYKATGMGDRSAGETYRNAPTLGWSDCGHNNYRPGIVCDPFLGSGTTAVAAAQLGRDCIGIDLDARNTGLVNQRLGEKVHVVDTNYRADRTVTYEAMDAPMFRPGYISNDGSVPNPNMAPKVSQTHTATSSSQTTVTWTCDAPLPDQRDQIEGQTNLFDLLFDMIDVDTGNAL